jgi:hypothetical protein
MVPLQLPGLQLSSGLNRVDGQGRSILFLSVGRLLVTVQYMAFQNASLDFFRWKWPSKQVKVEALRFLSSSSSFFFFFLSVCGTGV